MAQVFISYCRRDDTVARGLKTKIENNEMRVWMDEANLDAGADISANIAEAIVTSEVFLVILSDEAVESSWVKSEIAMAVNSRNSKGLPKIIPVSIGDVAHPVELQHFNILDVKQHEERILESVFKNSGVKTDSESKGVSDRVAKFLLGIESEEISIPQVGSFDIIERLKTLPRSGKLHRLYNFSHRVPIRTVYDHMLSLAHTADVLWPEISHGLVGNDKNAIAKCIAFHELNEVLLGDIPQQTDLLNREVRQERTNNPAFDKLSRYSVEERETRANLFIEMFLGEGNRQYLVDYMMLVQDTQSPITRFFRLLDKIDPIITIWRYIGIFRNKLNLLEIQEFMLRVDDFFNYQNPQEYMKKYSEDKKVNLLSNWLFDSEEALRFYSDKSILKVIDKNCGFTNGVTKRLISGRKIEWFVNLNSSDVN